MDMDVRVYIMQEILADTELQEQILRNSSLPVPDGFPPYAFLEAVAKFCMERGITPPTITVTSSSK